MQANRTDGVSATDAAVADSSGAIDAGGAIDAATLIFFDCGMGRLWEVSIPAWLWRTLGFERTAVGWERHVSLD